MITDEVTIKSKLQCHLSVYLFLLVGSFVQIVRKVRTHFTLQQNQSIHQNTERGIDLEKVVSVTQVVFNQKSKFDFRNVDMTFIIMVVH